MPDTHRERLEDRKHCPQLPGRARQRAYQADVDAVRLAADVRELDPNEIWGRLNRWGKENPERLIAAAVSLAAMVDQEVHTVGQPPEWCRAIGGTAALHPDYEPVPAQKVAHTRPHQLDAEILRLAEAGDLSDHEIALRVGASVNTVYRVRIDNGLRRHAWTPAAEMDAKVAELEAQGIDRKAIARLLGTSERTVDRSRARMARSEVA